MVSSTSESSKKNVNYLQGKPVYSFCKMVGHTEEKCFHKTNRSDKRKSA